MWEPDGCRWDLAFSRHSSLVTCHCSSDLGLRTFLLVTRHSSLVTVLLTSDSGLSCSSLVTRHSSLLLWPQFGMPRTSHRKGPRYACSPRSLREIADPPNPGSAPASL